MSLFLVKFRNIMRGITGSEPPLLGIIIEKGVVNAAISVMVTSALRCFYRGMDVFGSILIYLTVKYPKEKDPIPPIGDRNILRESVTNIAEKIRCREITAEEVVRTFIDRIHEINGQLNSVVDERFHTAIQEAKTCDRIIQSGEYDIEDLRTKFPLLGIPFTIKDSYALEGLKHTTGLHYRKDITAEKDSEVVTILRNHGAIPLGVTNVPELCLWWETVNTIYGRSKNPYDTRHITGGSSGGEASIQGAAGSGFGIGSDIGGSIRMPAFFCGVYGHKPTIGLVSNVGQEPKLEGRLEDFLTTGPIVRHPQDLELLFRLMCAEKESKLLPVPDLKKIRIFYMEDDGGSAFSTPINSEIKTAIRKVTKFLEYKHGIKPQVANIKKLYYSLEIWAHGMAQTDDMTLCQELVCNNGIVNPYWEIIRFIFQRSPHTLPALVLGILEKLAAKSRGSNWHKEMLEMGFSLSKEINELLGNNGVLIYPTHPNSAPRHYKPLFRAADFSYCAIFNVLGVPVTQVPLGLDSNNLPIGVQVVGGMFSDLLTIKIAQELHEGFGGWIPPCQVKNENDIYIKENKCDKIKFLFHFYDFVK